MQLVVCRYNDILIEHLLIIKKAPEFPRPSLLLLHRQKAYGAFISEQSTHALVVQ